MPCLHQNSSIYNIDISQNELSFNILNQIETVLRGHRSSIQTVKLQNLQTFWDIDSMKNQFPASNLLRNLKHMDLSMNSKQNENIIQLLDHFIQMKSIENIQILTLNYCGIMDDQCETLAKLIEDNKRIKEVSLIENKFTWKGFKVIFDPILNNKSTLVKLNISKNYIDEQYFKDITPAKIIPLTNFRLLIIDGNKFKEHAYGITLLQIDDYSIEKLLSTKCMQKHYRKQKNIYIEQLYIYNNWMNVTEAFAQQIINQYVLFASEINLTKEVPHYLTQLIIRNTKLSDQFFMWFGSQYFKFPYLKVIDFQGSIVKNQIVILNEMKIRYTKNMTNMSKMHMYIDIINENFVNYNIIEVCFDQNQADQPNQFDDGLFKYWLLNLKVFLQNKNHISLQKMGYIVNETEQVRWGKIGKWLVHLINKTLNLIQSLSYDFRFSSSLHSYTRKQLTKIKICMTVGSIVEIIKILLGIGVLSMRISIKDILNKCETASGQCFQNDLHSGFFGEAIIFIALVLIQTFSSLLFAINIRLKATPDYCIQTTEMVRFQRFKFAHKNEVWLCILQFIVSFNFFFECRIMGSNLEIISFIRDNELDNLIGLKNLIIIVLSFMASFIFLKAILQAYVTLKFLLLFLKTPNAEQANILQQCLLKVQADHMLNVEQVLRNFCPQTGIYIKERLWNYKQIFESIHGFIEFAILVDVIILAKYKKDFLSEQSVSNMFTSTDIITIIYYVITILKISTHVYQALLSRPPQLKVSDLNEVLLLRRYQKLGNSLQIIQQIPKKDRLQSSLQSITKKSQDFKFGSIMKTKSDRSIILQKNTIQQFDEELDYIQENIQLPIGTIQYKSMKSIQLKS